MYSFNVQTHKYKPRKYQYLGSKGPKKDILFDIAF